jgi:RNA polymerase sigma factor (sigma-70 family)
VATRIGPGAEGQTQPPRPQSFEALEQGPKSQPSRDERCPQRCGMGPTPILQGSESTIQVTTDTVTTVPEVSRRGRSFDALYSANVWHVYRFLAFRIQDRDTAEDLTQATFERALRAWPRFDPRRAGERTWLLTIARNVLVDHLRRRTVAPMGELDEVALGVEDALDERYATSHELAAALARLGEREREVLGLRFAADLSAAEIATTLDISVANAQQILSRSLRRLRAELSGSDLRRQPGDAPGPSA